MDEQGTDRWRRAVADLEEFAARRGAQFRRHDLTVRLVPAAPASPVTVTVLDADSCRISTGTFLAVIVDSMPGDEDHPMLAVLGAISSGGAQEWVETSGETWVDAGWSITAERGSWSGGVDWSVGGDRVEGAARSRAHRRLPAWPAG